MHRDCVMLRSLLRVSPSNVKYPALPAKASEVWQRKETTQNLLVRRSCCGRTHSTTTFIRRRQLRRVFVNKRPGFAAVFANGVVCVCGLHFVVGRLGLDTEWLRGPALSHGRDNS